MSTTVSRPTRPGSLDLHDRIALRRLADRAAGTEPASTYAAGYRDALVDTLRWMTGSAPTLNMARACRIVKAADWPPTAELD